MKRPTITEEERDLLNDAIDHWLLQEPFPLLKNNITMDDVAEAMNMERSHLSNYIYEVRGDTFASWLSDIKLEYCRKILINTDLSISEIAYRTGYNDLAAMSKAFKKKFGISPRSFRQQTTTI